MTQIDTSQDVTWQELFAWQYLSKLLVLCLAVWLHAANSMLTATLMPVVVQDIGGVEFISWAFALYLMGSIVAATSISVFVAKYPFRKVLMAATVIYGLGCLICGAAPYMTILLLGRAIQGLGGGALIALVFVSQDRFFPNRFVPRVVAFVSIVWTLSAFFGPAVGGIFANYGMWRHAFWLFTGLACLLLVVIPRLLENDLQQEEFSDGFIPVVRLGFIAASILLFSAAGVQANTAFSSLLLLVGAGFLILFVVRDKQVTQNRLLPRHAISLSHPVGLGISMTFVFCLSIMSFLVYGPVLLIKLYDLTPLQAGFVVLLESVGWGLGAVLLSGLPRHVEPKLIKWGGIFLLAGVVGQAWFLPYGPLWAVIVTALSSNFGFGMMWGYIIKHVVGYAEKEDKDRASGILPSTQQTGFALGAALTGVIANSFGFETLTEYQDFQQVSFWLFAGFIPIISMGLWLAWRFSRSISH